MINMKQNLEIIQNIKIADDVFEMKLKGVTANIKNPGQFINILIENKYLRRPISISDWDKESLTIVYKTIGKGTDWLSHQTQGKILDVLMPLGNGFDLDKNFQLVIGGGVGIPPLVGVCKKLNSEGIKPNIILGFQSKKDIFYLEKFNALGNVFVCTDDGSYGEHGLVTNIMSNENLCNIPYVTCGPLPMEKAINNLSDSYGLISLEARMGCGFGACMGCSIETKSGPKRICKDGPVFKNEDLLW